MRVYEGLLRYMKVHGGICEYIYIYMKVYAGMWSALGAPAAAGELMPSELYHQGGMRMAKYTPIRERCLPQEEELTWVCMCRCNLLDLPSGTNTTWPRPDS